MHKDIDRAAKVVTSDQELADELRKLDTRFRYVIAELYKRGYVVYDQDDEFVHMPEDRCDNPDDYNSIGKIVKTTETVI